LVGSRKIVGLCKQTKPPIYRCKEKEMSAKSITETEQPETIVDNLSEAPIAPPSQDAVEMNKLAMLKAKKQTKQMEQKQAQPERKERSIKFGVVGSGQAGSRLAEAFGKLGYDAVAINTAMQDLKNISLDDSNKLLLDYSLGGAAKELEIGKAAAEMHRSAIAQLVSDKLSTSQINLLCLSLGGGSGAGSCETMVEVLSETGKPLAVITILPMDTEDAQTKQNALETLAKLTHLAQSKKIANLIVVDNAKLERIYQGVGQMDFFGVANKAIVEPIDAFNTLSSMPSSVKPLDAMEWGKLFTDGEGLTVYGEMSVDNFREDTGLAEAVINNLDGNLLAGGFDLKQAKYVGVIFTANKDVWQAIPSSSINYAMAMINETCGSPKAVFKGIYTVEMPENAVKVYSMYSGLALPQGRIEQLKKDAKELSLKTKAKDEQRNLALKLDTGTEENVSAAQKVRDKIHDAKSAFGKLKQNAVQDRRK
jgi:cell division GTPase FtsZ